jgi:hypothetical protein
MQARHLTDAEKSTHMFQFIEQTLLTVFIWVGAWGLLQLLIEHFASNWITQAVLYFVMVAAGSVLMNYRGYV